MIITIAGKPGSGKSTAARLVAKTLGMKRHSAGDYRREMAKKRGLTIAEFNKLGEKEDFTDKDADDWQVNIGKTENNFIIDSRLGYHFIPSSIKIFLDVSPEVGARRIMHEKREEEAMPHEEEAIRIWHERVNSDFVRYKKYYGLDPYDFNNFDFVLDTSKFNAEEVVKKVLDFVRSKK